MVSCMLKGISPHQGPERVKEGVPVGDVHGRFLAFLGSLPFAERNLQE